MLIGKLAQKTGLTTYTIRFYEKQGLLAKRFIQRGDNNYRHYSEEAVERITVIKTFNASGFRLSEIKDLMDRWDAGDPTRHDGAMFLQQKLDEINARISKLRNIKTTLMRTLGAHILQSTSGNRPPKKVR